MADQDVFDVIIIGAGIVGSATAYTLAKSSNKTLLLEQFTLPHSRGSSHGASRITRKAYVQQYYANMMAEAYKLWDTLEKESGTQLYVKTGLLMFGKPTCPSLKGTEDALQKIKSVYESLNGDQLSTRFSQFKMPSQYVGLVDPEAGLLKSHRGLVAYQTVFQRNGGKLLDEVKVDRILPGKIVTVCTNKGNFRARSVVITAGPWTSKLTKPLGFHIPLQPVRVSVNYWREKNPGEFDSSKFPCFIKSKDEHFSHDIYGLPAEDYPNCVKICLHIGPNIDPDERDLDKTSRWDIDMVQQFVRKFTPSLNDDPCIVERCIYTMTPDEDFVLDTHPHWKNIVVGAGFSGHGFKLAPVTGKLLAEMATGKNTSYDTTPFKLDRFLHPKGSSRL